MTLTLIIRKSQYYDHKNIVDAIYTAVNDKDIEIKIVDQIKCGNCGNEIMPDDILLSTE